MTDNEINARVAALRGHTIAQDADGWYIVSDSTHRWPLADYCNDPVAWAALLVWLTTQAMTQVSLVWTWKPGKQWQASIWWKHKMVTAEDPLPGRALALAALRAHGVTL